LGTPHRGVDDGAMPAVADGDVGRDWRVMKPADAGFILLSLGAGR
jgi:hypothetical protein